MRVYVGNMNVILDSVEGSRFGGGRKTISMLSDWEQHQMYHYGIDEYYMRELQQIQAFRASKSNFD